MSAEPIPLRRFYVYVLKNENGDVFYVGRGTGGRMMQHISWSHSRGVNDVIADAVAGDAKISAEVISWHATAFDAEKEERALIKSFPAGTLANVAHAKPKKRPKRPKLPPPPKREPIPPKPGALGAEIYKLAAKARKHLAAYEHATAQRDEAIKRHAADMTLGAIAEAAGISVGRVSHIVGYRGVKVGRPRKNIPPPS